MRKRNLSIILTATLALACGSDDGSLAWEPESIIYHQPDGSRTEVAVDGDCAELSGDVCVDPGEKCEGSDAAEVYLDEDGQVLEVICLPAHQEGNADLTVLDGGQSEVSVGNNDIFVLEGTADEPAFVGDLELDSNNVTIWGDDPETSILDGDLSVTKNNALVSGITVTGDVVVTFNDAQFSNCVIDGNLVLKGNNAKIAGCFVKGDVVVEGNNTAFTLTTLGGEYTDSGQNTTCDEVRRVVDGERVDFECSGSPD